MTGSLADKIISDVLADLEKDQLLLPTLPEVAIRVRDTIEDENAGTTEVASVIMTDAALSARLIQIANSPLLRAPMAIESVEMAVSRMGANMVRNLVTSIAMEQMFQATTDASDKLLRNLWEHSTEVAAISHALTSQFTKLQPDQALLAGLVHDIGALPIITRAEDIPELLANEPLLVKVIHETHARVGQAILSKWNFPANIVAVAAEHENLNRNSPATDYVDVVTVANLQSYVGTEHPLTKQDWSKVPAFAKLGLDPGINVVEMDETSEAIEAIKLALT